METDLVQSVTQVTQAVKGVLESNFREVWIQGEVSNFKRQSSGHLYFSLKDPGAQIGAVMWRGSAGHLRRLPKDGDQLIVRGELNVYPPRGSYQVVVHEVQFVGLGELLLKLEELKREIAKRGWFKVEYKKPLPKFPRRLGIVTSPTGAAIRDVLNVLERRHGRFHLVVNPVRVQGETAGREVAQAIRQMNQYQLCDVMIVCRGGGSLEDLWAFNEEVVAQAVFESEIPVIAAVGHESDHTIAEYVADVRAPTPSAAAEVVMAERAQHVQFLDQSRVRVKQTLGHLLKHAREKLRRFESHPAMATPYGVLGPWMQRLDEIRLRLPVPNVKHAREKLVALEEHLRAIDPRTLVKKGYSILFDEKSGTVISSVKQLKKNDRLRAMVGDGEARVVVDEV